VKLCEVMLQSVTSADRCAARLRRWEPSRLRQ